MSELTAPFKTLMTEIKKAENESIWTNIHESDNPIDVKLPDNLELKLDIFQRMIIYKIFREEKLVSLIKNFVLNILGKVFIESPVFDLKGSFKDSSPTTPIVFVLSPGADPISYLLSLAKEN